VLVDELARAQIRLYDFLDEERVTASPLENETFERHFDRIFQQRCEQLFGTLPAQWIEPVLDVVALVRPLVPVVPTENSESGKKSRVLGSLNVVSPHAQACAFHRGRYRTPVPQSGRS
jgi:hypothetical protein